MSEQIEWRPSQEFCDWWAHHCVVDGNAYSVRVAHAAIRAFILEAEAIATAREISGGVPADVAMIAAMNKMVNMLGITRRMRLP